MLNTSTVPEIAFDEEVREPGTFQVDIMAEMMRRTGYDARGVNGTRLLGLRPR